MLKDITLGQFFPGTSVVHRLDPRTKLLLLVGYIVGRYLLKLPLLNNLGSITGGMTSTPALGTLISTAKTDDVASAYASTYPIALILVVLASQLLITLM